MRPFINLFIDIKQLWLLFVCIPYKKHILPLYGKKSLDHDYYLVKRTHVIHGFPLITIIK